MEKYKIICLREHPGLIEASSVWFCQKWGIPQSAYAESMEQCVVNAGPSATVAVPQWYIVSDGGKIVGGLGVIENDFHDRKDLAPNVCAVYVEKEYRCRGIAGKMLDFVCRDLAKMGVNTLYLITGHTSFYERYGWEFLCMARGDGEDKMSRMYVRRTGPGQQLRR